MAVRPNHLAILSALALAGCGGGVPSLSLPNIKPRNDYIGKPITAITSQIGWPDYQETIGGQKVYTWRRGAGAQECYIKAVMNGDVVESYEARGDAAICSPYDAKASE